MATTTFTPGGRLEGIAFASDGTAYVVDSVNKKIHRIAPDGTVTANWVSFSTTSNRYRLCIDTAGNVYASLSQSTISKITPSGTVTNDWCTGLAGTSALGPQGLVIDSNGVITTHTHGTSFNRIDSSGTITGTYSKASGSTGSAGIAINTADGTVYWTEPNGSLYGKVTSSGTATSPWVSRSGARRVAVDANTGIVYATDVDTSALHKIEANGTPTWSWVSTSSGDCFLAVGPQGNIYVGYDSGSITKITPEGAVTTGWASTAAGDFLGQLEVDPLGNVWRITGDGATVYKIDDDQVSLSSPPDPPTSLTATPGDESLSIAFTAGADNGAEITNYEYTLDDGSTWTALSPADATSPITVPGLTNGTAYAIKLRAVNSAGSGDPSAEVTGTPATVPAAPTDLVATPSNASATIAFTAGDDGGATITGYEYTIDDGVTWQAVATWE